MERVLLTLLNVLHFQMEARYEDANCLRTLPIQQLNDLDKQNVLNTVALLIWCVALCQESKLTVPNKLLN